MDISNLFWPVLLFSLGLPGVHSFPTSKENVWKEIQERTQNWPTRFPANAFHPQLICIKKQHSEMLFQHPGYRLCIQSLLLPVSFGVPSSGTVYDIGPGLASTRGLLHNSVLSLTELGKFCGSVNESLREGGIGATSSVPLFKGERSEEKWI